ncbi:MAG: ABC transporter permease subunit, partial [Acidimicrobiia bacterium]|nr:ABC transporter permease subunit [Acidimicrobiia bacterium]
MSATLASDFWDNENLDTWEIPFGLWTEEITFWLTTHIKGFLDAVKWPVDKLLELIIDNLLQDWLPWPAVLLLFFLVGALTRNVRVGLGSAAALAVCGLLGNEYWDLTMETVGMVIVAVLICTAFGIPLGIVASRFDRFWNRLRPILDGMQVIHPFVYLLPIIFLFGVRRTPGVLATLVFALPPIVRLTNLGLRQVPGDVVEAARAFGAPERRVLREVQLPLARPAIMAGLNQTLLLSLSMVGIVAIIAG